MASLVSLEPSIALPLVIVIDEASMLDGLVGSVVPTRGMDRLKLLGGCPLLQPLLGRHTIVLPSPLHVPPLQTTVNGDLRLVVPSYLCGAFGTPRSFVPCGCTRSLNSSFTCVTCAIDFTLLRSLVFNKVPPALSIEPPPSGIMLTVLPIEL